MSAYPRRTTHIALLLLSVLLLIATLWWPRQASSQAELQEARLGAPVPFVVQDLTAYDLPLPRTYTFQSPWENPTRILWMPLVLSLLLVFLLLELLAFLFLRPRPGAGRKERGAPGLSRR